MKKVLLATVALFTFNFVAAQEDQTFGFEQGNIILEGNFMFNSVNDKNTELKTNAMEFNPKVGYFISEDFALGIELMVGSEKEELAGNEILKANMFGAGVFARYYFLDLGKRFKTFSELGAGFVNTKVEQGGGEFKMNGFGVGVNLGMNYFVKENIAISFVVSDVLSYSSMKPDGGEAISEFDANFNVFNNFFAAARFGLLFKF